tara:strand:- start:25235 stop:25771 length:537 start_codon:yes stop_codon:yes gene_type:complete
MVETGIEAKNIIEVPIVKKKNTTVSMGNILALGGVMYLMYKTFMLEERMNDLTVMMKRNNTTWNVHDGISRNVNEREEEYETSDDEREEEKEKEKEHEDKMEEEEVSNKDDHQNIDEDIRREQIEVVRKEQYIEDLPREVPPQGVHQRNTRVAESSTFVTTRQRRSESELRREPSRSL